MQFFYVSDNKTTNLKYQIPCYEHIKNLTVCRTSDPDILKWQNADSETALLSDFRIVQSPDYLKH